MKRGQRIYVKGDGSTQVFTERIDMYVKMRMNVEKIRKATPNDEYSWERHLRDVEIEQLDGSTADVASGKRKVEIAVNTYDCAADEVVGV